MNINCKIALLTSSSSSLIPAVRQSDKVMSRGLGWQFLGYGCTIKVGDILLTFGSLGRYQPYLTILRNSFRCGVLRGHLQHPTRK